MNRTIKNHDAVAEPLRLGPVSCLVLGLIGLRGPSTPYDLKKAVGRSVSYFWPFPHSQLYGEPERLAEAGLLSCKTEQTGRRRKLYSLTRKGDAALKQWLQTSPGELFEMRDMAVLQLFFSEFTSEENLVALAKDQARLARERLATYAQIDNKYLPRMGRNRRMMPLFLGIKMAKVYLEFWDDIAGDPPPAGAGGTDAPRPRRSPRRARQGAKV
jgi:DNA-binding PadR family transcriptional regulator